MTVHRPPADRPSAPQENQYLLSHFLATLGAQEETDCTSMLWSIDSCQNKISADQYHLTESRAQVSTHRHRVLFWSYPLISYWFSNDRRLKFIFFNLYEICCVYIIMAPQSLFIGFLVERSVACQSRKSDFGWHRFCFSPCLMHKEDSKFSSDSRVTW